ncbi:hypothetical protein FRX31_002056, partial [Thalictrum thalictroides]
NSKSIEIFQALDKRRFAQVFQELKNSSKSQGNDGPVSLDENGAVARSIVEKHAADRLGRVDYALASGGAMVVTHSEPLFPSSYCRGSNGFVEIKLRRDIIPDAVTLSVAYDRSSAPKHCQTLGWFQLPRRNWLSYEDVKPSNFVGMKCKV